MLTEIPVADRAPVLRRYLDLTANARPYFPVGRDAPLEDFAAIADRYPVFLLRTDR